jgi:uncharacterized protein (DUF1800 family)
VYRTPKTRSFYSFAQVKSKAHSSGMSTTVNKITPYSQPWTEKQLKHLLIRTLFGVARENLSFFKGKGLEECVDTLLRTIPMPSPPVFRTKDDPKNLVPEGASFVFAPETKERDEDWTIYIKAWWVGLMLNPQNNIREKMVLFWHNHFVIQFNTVKDSRYAYNYLNILRKHATGNFKSMLREITTAPGMLVYLNGNLNNKVTPNENYGRELQELFTIGKSPQSHYTEMDVKSAGRVLTGWKDDKVKIGCHFSPAVHNTEDKAFSAFYNNHIIKGKPGQDGAKETDELIEMICANPEVSKFLCRKLYRWFVHNHIDEQVEKTVISPLAEIMRQSDYEVKPVLKALFTGSFFYNSELMGAMFKSPVDFFAGIARELNFEIQSNLEGWFLISEAIKDIGQELGNPPNVAGWPAYYEFPSFDRNWVNSEYLSQRNGFKDFTFEGFNKKDAPYIVVDLLKFARLVPYPADAKTLVDDTLKFLCIIEPGAGQKSYLEEILNNKGIGNTWEELWHAHQNRAGDEKLKEELRSRLRKMFDVILIMPEYQIM